MLADPNRVRLLVLLEREELTVAELAAITLLAQPRVSTHLARLRESALVCDRRAGVQSYYRFHEQAMSGALADMWAALKANLDDAMITADAERLPAVLAARAQSRNWADSVAGDMERHYSPGRTWEATARAALQLLELGDVLDVASGDGVLAELLAPRSATLTCVDFSEKVVKAGRRRLKRFPNVRFVAGDMHQMDFPDSSFDVALLMHALTYTERPAEVIAELFRVLRAGGLLVGATLKRHDHRQAVAPYDHVNLGFTPAALRRMCTQAGFAVERCEVTSREARAPHFEVITLNARRPA